MSTRSLDWDKLRVFSVVAELNSFTAAATRLGESTPTVSRKVDELERMLKCELVSRSTRGVELTEAGRLVLRRVHAMSDSAEIMWNEISTLDTRAGGKVRFSCGDGLGVHWLAPRLPQFHAEFPQIEFNLNISELDIDVLSDEVDMTFTFVEPRHRDIVSQRMGTMHYMFFASQDYIDKHGEPESVFELQDHKMIIHDGYIYQIDNWPARATSIKKILDYAVVSNSGSVMREVCARSGGIGIFPSYVVDYDQRLVPLRLPEIAPIQFWLTYSERFRRLPRGQVVADWIRKTFDTSVTPWFGDNFVHPRRFKKEMSVVPPAFPGEARFSDGKTSEP